MVEVTKIVLAADCGNSPKMEFLKEFNIAFAKGDLDFLLESVSDHIKWNIIGEKKIEGIAGYKQELSKMKEEKVTEIILESILTHGKYGAVNGIFKMKDGRLFSFADFYQFSGAKGQRIESIISYVIGI